MILICAWCQAYLGEKEPIYDYTVTHGMCQMCHDDAVERLRRQEPFREMAETVWGAFEIGGEG